MSMTTATLVVVSVEADGTIATAMGMPTRVLVTASDRIITISYTTPVADAPKVGDLLSLEIKEVET